MNQKFTNEQKKTIMTRYCNGETAASLCIEYTLARITFYGWAKALDIDKKMAQKLRILSS